MKRTLVSLAVLATIHQSREQAKHAEAMDETAEWARPQYTREQMVDHATALAEKAYHARQLDQAIATIERHAGKQYPRMATLASPRGSMGEEVHEPELPWLMAMKPITRMELVAAYPPRDPYCVCAIQCPGALGKGCYLCEPGPFDGAGTTWTRTTAGPDGVHVEVVPESEWREPIPGREWSGIPGDPFIHLERTRRTPLGAEPWDHGAGEAA